MNCSRSSHTALKCGGEINGFRWNPSCRSIRSSRVSRSNHAYATCGQSFRSIRSSPSSRCSGCSRSNHRCCRCCQSCGCNHRCCRGCRSCGCIRRCFRGCQSCGCRRCCPSFRWNRCCGDDELQRPSRTRKPVLRLLSKRTYHSYAFPSPSLPVLQILERKLSSYTEDDTQNVDGEVCPRIAHRSGYQQDQAA